MLSADPPAALNAPIDLGADLYAGLSFHTAFDGHVYDGGRAAPLGAPGALHALLVGQDSAGRARLEPLRALLADPIAAVRQDVAAAGA